MTAAFTVCKRYAQCLWCIRMKKTTWPGANPTQKNVLEARSAWCYPRTCLPHFEYNTFAINTTSSVCNIKKLEICAAKENSFVGRSSRLFRTNLHCPIYSKGLLVETHWVRKTVFFSFTLAGILYICEIFWRHKTYQHRSTLGGFEGEAEFARSSVVPLKVLRP